MSENTPRERVLKLLRGEQVDQPPCFSGMGNVTTAGLKEHNLRFAQVHLDAKMMAAAAASTVKLFGYDAAVVPFDLGVEAELLGAKLNVYPDSEDLLYPTLREKTAQSADDLRIPDDLEHQGRIPLVVEAIRLLREEFGNEIAIGSYVLGPFTLAGQVIDLNRVLKMSLKNPAEMHRILSVLSDVIIQVAGVYAKAGVDFLSVRDMGASSGMLSPRTFREFVKPQLTRIMANIDCATVLHICGDTNDIIQDMIETGADALSVDQKCDVAKARETIGNDAVILGNFDPYKVLVTGTPELAEQTMRRCFDAGVSAVWPGCDIWPTVEPEVMLAYVKAAKVR